MSEKWNSIRTMMTFGFAMGSDVVVPKRGQRTYERELS